MGATFTLEYWIDDGWHVGRLKETPGVFRQGETLEELEENIRDAYRLMLEDRPSPPVSDVKTRPIGIPA